MRDLRPIDSLQNFDPDDLCIRNALLKFISPVQIILLINTNNYEILMIHKELLVG